MLQKSSVKTAFRSGQQRIIAGRSLFRALTVRRVRPSPEKAPRSHSAALLASFSSNFFATLGLSQLTQKSGAALLTVLVALMVISIMLFEFQYGAMVERKLAYNELNQLQAYYLAKSGARLGLLRINLYARAKKDATIKKLIDQVPQASGFIDSIWSLPLPAFPPDATNLSELAAPDKDAAERVLDQTKVSDGKSTHVISDESTKINLNDLMVPTDKRDLRVDFRSDTPQGHFWYTGRLLINLMDNFLRESENPSEEYGDLSPEETVFNIMDWVTPGDNSFIGGSKDLFYEKLVPPYKAKRNRLYTIDELRLIKGIDETLYNKLKPHVTVYADQGKININTTNREDFYKALVPGLRSEDIKKVLEERDKRSGWSSVEDFANYIKTTFGGAEFEKLYPKKDEYPFSVASQSFIVESMGRLDRSKSSIQKIIRVAVSLRSTGADCGAITDTSQCGRTPGCFFRKAPINACQRKAKTQEECISLGAGSTSFEQAGDNQLCCTVPSDQLQERICFNPKTETPKAGEFNAIKIVQWSEA